MKKEDLRPIGTRFEKTYPPNPRVADDCEHTFTYEVVEHVKVSPYGTEYTEWAERLDVVDMKERKPISSSIGPCPHCGQIYIEYKYKETIK